MQAGVDEVMEDEGYRSLGAALAQAGVGQEVIAALGDYADMPITGRDVEEWQAAGAGLLPEQQAAVLAVLVQLDGDLASWVRDWWLQSAPGAPAPPAAETGEGPPEGEQLQQQWDEVQTDLTGAAQTLVQEGQVSSEDAAAVEKAVAAVTAEITDRARELSDDDQVVQAFWSVPSEVWKRIFDQLSDMSSLIGVSRVNRAWHTYVQQVLDKTVPETRKHMRLTDSTGWKQVGSQEALQEALDATGLQGKTIVILRGEDRAFTVTRHPESARFVESRADVHVTVARGALGVRLHEPAQGLVLSGGRLHLYSGGRARVEHGGRVIVEESDTWVQVLADRSLIRVDDYRRIWVSLGVRGVFGLRGEDEQIAVSGRRGYGIPLGTTVVDIDEQPIELPLMH